MQDDLTSWQNGVLAMCCALATAFAMGKLLKQRIAPGRNVAIDGLRGYLAFGVFLAHAVLWHGYVRGAGWRSYSSSVYSAMGVYCVSVFFMITSFLFVGKLLDARERQIDWLALFVSRILRLTPLYFIATAWIFLVVAILTDWSLREPWTTIVPGALRWLSFALVDARDLNGLPGTAVLNAGVNWSLKYEWLFYFSLPAIAIVLRVRAPLALAAIGLTVIGIVASTTVGTALPIAFIQGAIAAWLCRRKEFAATLRLPACGLIVLASVLVLLSNSAPNLVVKVLLMFSFTTVAAGNTVFGLLSNRAAIILGDYSYGIYLLHGLLLTTVFTFVVGRQQLAALSVPAYWLLVAVIGCAVVILSALSFWFVEAPMLKQTKRVSASLRHLFANSFQRGTSGEASR